jgi:hypothetical protein
VSAPFAHGSGFLFWFGSSPTTRRSIVLLRLCAIKKNRIFQNPVLIILSSRRAAPVARNAAPCLFSFLLFLILYGDSLRLSGGDPIFQRGKMGEKPA